MPRRLGVLAALLLVPASALAEELAPVPEQLLAADSVLYFRFDGFDAHRATYEQTAVGGLMKGDLGNFFNYLGVVLKDSVGPALAKEEVLGGKRSENLKYLRQGFDQVPNLMNYFGKNGFVLGVEVIDLKALRSQMTLVFPNGAEGKNRATLVAGLRLAAALAKVPVKDVDLDGRAVSQFDPQQTEPLKIAWWAEGKHLVLTLGTEGPAPALARIKQNGKGLAGSPLFQAVTTFHTYETAGRGYLDLERLVKMGRSVDPRAGRLIDELGLAGLKDLTIQAGFEGLQERSTLVLHLTGPRKGLLARPPDRPNFVLEKLPPCPPDAATMIAIQLDLAALYDTIVPAVEAGVATFYPDAKPLIGQALKGVNLALGIDLRKDLLSQLGPLVTLYSSPSEGPLSLGVGLVIEVKDAQKVQAALDTLGKSLPGALGADVSIKKELYHGADVHTFHVTQQGFFFMPSYCIYKNWLVVGMFPQTVQGFILRSGENYSKWQPTDLAKKALAETVTERPHSRVIALTVTDPRPSVKQLFALGPLIGGLVNSFSPGSFDIRRIPNAQVVAEPLFPNVTILADDDEALWLESHMSLDMPLPVAGMDTYFIALFGFQLFRFGF